MNHRTCKKWAPIALCIGLLGAPISHAHELGNELTGGFSSGGGAQGVFDFGSGISIIGINSTYLFGLAPMIQLGPRIGLIYVSGSSDDAHIFVGLAEFRFNFGAATLNDTAYIAPAVGIYTGDGLGANFTFEFKFGKRFALGDRVSYAPSLGIYKVGDAGMRFRLDLISFSIFF